MHPRRQVALSKSHVVVIVVTMASNLCVHSTMLCCVTILHANCYNNKKSSHTSPRFSYEKGLIA